MSLSTTQERLFYQVCLHGSIKKKAAEDILNKFVNWSPGIDGWLHTSHRKSCNVSCVFKPEVSNLSSGLANQGPISRTIFRNSNSMEISLCSHWRCIEVIAMKFCTWQDSCAVMACAKFCSDLMSYNGITVKQIFHRNWMAMEKSPMKWAPGLFDKRSVTSVTQHQRYGISNYQ